MKSRAMKSPRHPDILVCKPEGCQPLAGGRSSAQPPGKFIYVRTLKGCRTPLPPHRPGTLSGCSRSYREARGYRFAQPPANGCQASGLDPWRSSSASIGGSTA